MVSFEINTGKFRGIHLLYAVFFRMIHESAYFRYLLFYFESMSIEFISNHVLYQGFELDI